MAARARRTPGVGDFVPAQLAAAGESVLMRSVDGKFLLPSQDDSPHPGIPAALEKIKGLNIDAVSCQIEKGEREELVRVFWVAP